MGVCCGQELVAEHYDDHSNNNDNNTELYAGR